MGPPAKPSAAGSLGRGGAVERASFRPYEAETREKVNCSAGAREAALGRMELATTKGVAYWTRRRFGPMRTSAPTDGNGPEFS